MQNDVPYVLCKLSTNALIIRNGKILLLQLNRPEDKKGLWSFPGGKVDKGETFNQGLEREVLEETGIPSDAYTYERVAILHDEPETTCKHIFILNLNKDIEDIAFDPKEIMQAKFFDLNEETLQKLEYRNDWLLPVMMDYINGRLNKNSLYTVQK